MAKIVLKDLKHLAKLANLKLSTDQENKFLPQLDSVLKHIESLSDVDTSDVEPTSQTTGMENVFRNDEIDASSVLTSTEAISGTDKTHNDYFVVDMLLAERSDD